MAQVPAPFVVSVEFSGPGLAPHAVVVEPGAAVLLDPNEICPEAVASNTAIGFSGRHDHGSLATLRSSGPLLEVVSALKAAKQGCDSYLTALIEGSAAAADASAAKKPRLAGDDGSKY